jgi:hypothetical protein
VDPRVSRGDDDFQIGSEKLRGLVTQTMILAIVGVAPLQVPGDARAKNALLHAESCNDFSICSPSTVTRTRVAALNHRYAMGQPSNAAAAAGVFIYAIDGPGGENETNASVVPWDPSTWGRRELPCEWHNVCGEYPDLRTCEDDEPGGVDLVGPCTMGNMTNPEKEQRTLNTSIHERLEPTTAAS